MTLSLQGRVALVTRGSRATGRAAAEELAHRGAHVILNYFQDGKVAKAACEEMRAKGMSVEIIRASVAKGDQVAAMFDFIREHHGRLDILVNNAAIGVSADFSTLSEQDWRRIYDVNFHGARLCCTQALPMMVERGNGVIINISSPGSSQVIGNYSAVGSSQAALESLTRYLAVEYGRRGIRINTAACGPIDDDAFRKFPSGDQLLEAASKATPLGRPSRHEDLAQLVGFLVSDEASWITGQVIMADGGLTSLAPALSRDFLHDAASAPSPSPSASESTKEKLHAEDGGPAGEKHSARSFEQSRADVSAGSSNNLGPSSRSFVNNPTENVDHSDEIAIVGMGLAIPGANSPEEFWQLLHQSENLFSEPGERLNIDHYWSADPKAEDIGYSRKAGYIQGFHPHPRLQAELNAGGINPLEHSALWLRHSILQALDDVHLPAPARFQLAVGLTPEGNQHLDETLVVNSIKSMFPDLQCQDLLKQLYPHAVDNPSTVFPHQLPRLAMEGILPSETEVVVVDTACSSSLYAIDIGIKALREGDVDIAVCGGAFALSSRLQVLFSKLGGLSTSSEVRSFAKDANGTVFSDGAGVVVLKRYDQAVRDGDRILGLALDVGNSSDGHGKAINAPNWEGQKLAVENAFATSGIAPDQVDWVVAHATGTPGGDATELRTLQSTACGARWALTSNKALVGHTGWAAGVVSVIHALLGMKYESIPPQPMFGATRTPPPLDGALYIPGEAQPWKRRKERPRIAGVSSFGFGGTNSFMLVQEPTLPVNRNSAAIVKASEDDPLVLVAWAAHLPGGFTRDQVSNWLKSDDGGPDATFGNYPLPEPGEIRLPPRALKSVDPSQLMIMRCARELAEHGGEELLNNPERIGVFLGHTGIARNGVRYALRINLKALKTAVPEELWESLVERIHQQAVPSNEDTLPGLMPNVTAARVAALLKLRGPNMAIDGGCDSVLHALGVAARYLKAGNIDVALVFALNANTDSEAVADLAGGATVAEGAFGLAVTRASLAKERCLPVLAQLEVLRGARANAIELKEPVTDMEEGRRTMLAAEGALSLLRATLGGGARTLVSREARGNLAIGVQPVDDQSLARGPVKRYLPVIRPAPSNKIQSAVPLILPDTLILASSRSLADVVPDGNQCAILVAGEIEGEEKYRAAIGDQIVRHIRVLVGGDDTESMETFQNLHDLCFLALQHHRELLNKGGSFVTLLLSAVEKHTPKPWTGLFTGFVKSLPWELPDCTSYILVTDLNQPIDAIAALAEESTLARRCPVTFLIEGKRSHILLRESPLSGGKNLHDRLGPDPVVVATGGARGITAEMLLALAEQVPLRLWLLGSRGLPKDSELQQLKLGKAALLKQWHMQEPGISLADLNGRYEQLSQAAEKAEILDKLRKYCGADRVHFLACDVEHQPEVEAAVKRILSQEGHVDLMLHGAGLHRSSQRGEPLEIFRRVRNVKVQGYLNLKSALAGNPPRIWCNVGSIGAYMGLPGDMDYTSANDFLCTSSAFAQNISELDEFTVSWTRWEDSGFAAKPIFRALMQRNNMLTSMPTKPATSYFLAELAEPRPRPNDSLYLGELELRSLEKISSRVLVKECSGRGRFFIPGKRETGSRRQWSVEIDLAKHAYLLDHLVDGRPCMPGAIMLEIAAEAAAGLIPDLVVCAFRDVTFSRYLRGPHEWWPTSISVKAERIEASAGAAVRVRVESEPKSLNGRPVGETRLHAEMTVELGRAPLPCTESWLAPHPDNSGSQIVDPYCLPGSPVLFDRSFLAVWNPRDYGSEIRAALDLSRAAETEIFKHFLIPSIAIDAVSRLQMLRKRKNNQRVSAFGTLARLDIRTSCNDAELHRIYGSGINVIHSFEDGHERSVMVAPDGHVLLEVFGVGAIERADFEWNTGKFHPTAKKSFAPV